MKIANGDPADRGKDIIMSRQKEKYRKGKVKPLEVEKLLYGENHLHKSGLKTDAKCRAAWEKHGDFIIQKYRDRRPKKDDNTFLPLSYTQPGELQEKR
jgi:viroplasmin and RNaseH domain-containing protein